MAAKTCYFSPIDYYGGVLFYIFEETALVAASLVSGEGGYNYINQWRSLHISSASSITCSTSRNTIIRDLRLVSMTIPLSGTSMQ